MQTNPCAAAAPAPRRLDPLPLLLIGVLLPAAIAAVNYALMERTGHGQAAAGDVCALFAWYVVQVGIVGLAVGRGIAHPWLRWIVFGWILLFINVLSGLMVVGAYFKWQPEQSMPPAALLAGQIGLCVVWAFLGDTRWAIRWPAMIVVTAGLLYLWLSLGNHGGQRMWNELLVLQVVTLSVLCGMLRLGRFRLAVLEGDQLAAGDERQRPLQFGIKHVLIWTTALAVVLGVARGLDLLRWQAALNLVRHGLLWKLTIATTSAMVIIVALWVALGRGHWSLRYSLGPIVVLAVGWGLAAWSSFNFATITRLRATGALIWWPSDSELLQWYEFGYWWIGWLLLSGGLLAATLIILRVLGYRLVRSRSAA